MEEFRAITFEDKDIINDFYAESGLESTNFSLVTLCAWQKCNELEISLNPEFIIIKINSKKGQKYYSPLVKNAPNYIKAIEELEKKSQNSRLAFELVCSWQVEILQQRGYECRNIREYAEYLYEAESLITLKGKKLSSKRNFINNFPVEYTFREYKIQDKPALMSLIGDWQDNKEETKLIENTDEDLSDHDVEERVLDDMLSDLAKYNCFCDVLEVEDNIVGFCVGEILPTKIGVIHFQKADISYRGCYALIDNLFVKKRFSQIKYVNKQEDMGIEGLRKSKLSYRPIRLVERWKAKKG